jgi:hypothetical protein
MHFVEKEVTLLHCKQELANGHSSKPEETGPYSKNSLNTGNLYHVIQCGYYIMFYILQINYLYHKFYWLFTKSVSII